MSRTVRISLAIAGIAVLLVTADVAGWFVIVRRMEAEVAAWQRARLAEGAVVLTGRRRAAAGRSRRNWCCPASPWPPIRRASRAR